MFFIYFGYNPFIRNMIFKYFFHALLENFLGSLQARESGRFPFPTPTPILFGKTKHILQVSRVLFKVDCIFYIKPNLSFPSVLYPPFLAGGVKGGNFIFSFQELQMLFLICALFWALNKFVLKRTLLFRLLNIFGN